MWILRLYNPSIAADSEKNGKKCEGGHVATSKQLRNLWKEASRVHRNGCISCCKSYMFVILLIIFPMYACMQAYLIDCKTP